jgi:putative transposase
MKLFHKPSDYQAFLKLMVQAAGRVPSMRLLAYCLMPNHWHLALWPRNDGDLAAYMSWLTNTHVRRWRQHWHSIGEGHVYQGRYKNFLVQKDDHFLTLIRYIEANPVRAKLVTRAQEWRWSSLTPGGDERPALCEWPVLRPEDWTQIVNAPLAEEQLERVRLSLKRGRPLGTDSWVKQTARRLGLEFTLRPRGRPRNQRKR